MAEPYRNGKHEKAILALLTYPTIEQAAKEAGIGARTLHRWLRDEKFQEKYRLARWRSVSQAIGRLQWLATEAVESLGEVFKDPKTPASSRVAAAKVVIEMSLRAAEIEEIRARINILEGRIEA